MKLVERIGVIGNGVVGNATARSWLEYAGEVHVYDNNPSRSTSSLSQVLNCNWIFVCLPTPSLAEGSCDLTPLQVFFRAVTGCRSKLVLRSTVPPGTTERFKEDYNLKHLLHSPEFLTARCSVMGAKMPNRNVVGGGGQAASGLAELYRRRWPGVPTIQTTSTESELIKLATNSFFAVKITYFNELKAISDKLHCNWDAVRRGVLSDGRIAPEHTEVPGPDGELGFGGACLPKDLANLAAVSLVKDATSHMMFAAGAVNRRIRHGG